MGKQYIFKRRHKKSCYKKERFKTNCCQLFKAAVQFEKEEMAYYRTVSAINYEYWKVNQHMHFEIIDKARFELLKNNRKCKYS